MSNPLAFNETLAHLLIARGSVAKPIDPNKQDWRQERFGSYYSSAIEGDVKATIALYERLKNGARPIYDKCGPSDFGMENRFNGTFTDSQLRVYYAFFSVLFDDEPEAPVDLVAGLGEFDGSFVNTLTLLSNGFTIDIAIETLGARVEKVLTSKAWDNYPLLYPKVLGD